MGFLFIIGIVVIWGFCGIFMLGFANTFMGHDTNRDDGTVPLFIFGPIILPLIIIVRLTYPLGSKVYKLGKYVGAKLG